MLLREYMEYAKVFPFIEPLVSQLNGKGEMLDRVLKTEHGCKSCGTAITCCLVDGQVPEDKQRQIAEYIYECNKQRWDGIFSFIDGQVNPLMDYSETKTVKYGKVVDDASSGKDTFGQTDKIAGFDSTDFVDSNNSQHDTTYGKTVKSTNSGEDVETIEKRNKQAERLVDYTMKFWDAYGVVKMLISDCVKCITLPIYELDI